MTGMFDNLVYWHWWILAITLLILEIFAPGAFFMWMAAAAGITGLVVLAIPDLSWQLQFVIFSVTSIVAIFAGYKWFRRNPIASDQPSIGKRSDDLIGQTYQVEQAIINGTGRIKVADSTWKAIGPDCAAGSKVRVIAVDAAIVSVELV